MSLQASGEESSAVTSIRCGEDTIMTSQHYSVSSRPSNISNTTCTDKTIMKTTRTVKNAEFPRNESDASTSNIFDRHCFHGGPVTVATIRFPFANTNTQQQHQKKDEQQIQEEQYELLKSQGRIVFARGPWIESHPLFRYNDNSANRDEITWDNGISNDTEYNNMNCKTHAKDERCYKILAFGRDNNHGSSTIEGVHGMIFPSSSSSTLEEANSGSRKMRRSSSSSLISVIAYGGRRISFLSGGGLWNDISNEECSTGPVADNFEPIPIIKTNKEKTMVKCTPYLEVSDWIHDARLLDLNSSSASANQALQSSVSTTCFLIAMGMANNNCEIWGFCTTMGTTASESGRVVLCPTRLQCITCGVRCMTYSLSFYGWDNEGTQLDHGDYYGNDEESIALLPSLVAASGTVFGDIVVWGAVGGNPVQEEKKTKIRDCDNHYLSNIVKRWILSDTNTNNGNDTMMYPPSSRTTSRIRVAPSYHLKGHLGSVFSVKFSGCGNYIASTSDDRSVRLWARCHVKDESATNNYDEDETHKHAKRMNPTEILASDSSHTYALTWTGWGHTARVWGVSFASSPSNSAQINQSSFPILVSAGEDSTARVWSPLTLSKKDEITYPLRGHRCESLWTVDVVDGIVVTGGNDGCVKLFDLESRLRSEEESVRAFAVPKDPPLLTTTSVPANGGGNVADQSLVKTHETNKSVSTKSPPKKKKKKKKAKTNGQAICGMEFYGSSEGSKVQSKMLVATRGGGLFSLDLMNNVWTDFSSWSEQVIVSSSDNETTLMHINPSSGSCVGVHPCGECAVVGTTEGWLVVSSICESSPSLASQRRAFHAPSYRPVQSVSFVDDNSLLVFYARGILIWFKFDRQSPIPLHVMTLGTTGIPLSFAYDDKDEAMYIGDSRGNIAYFDLSQTSEALESSETHRVKVHEEPRSLLAKAHGKEHVTGMTILKSTGTVISVGNDGCMHQCKMDASNGQLLQLTSVPIPNVTGLRHVWNVSRPNGEDSIIIGGFYGNDFVVLDSLNAYEFLRIPTGGRQRQQDFFFGFSNNNTSSLRFPDIFGMAILTGQKDGSGMIDFHFSYSFDKSLKNVFDAPQLTRDAIYSSYSIGTPVHAEAINDACWVKHCDSIYLLTGSNDCSVKLSKLVKNTFVSVFDLPPHESCVRGVCSSHHPTSDSSLLVTCGGKLSMEFYILDQTSPKASTSKGSILPCCVALLCSYRTLGKATIDHRMNAVRAIPLLSHEHQCHMVLSGDSDGNLHLCVVSEHVNARGTIIGTVLKGNGRPVLCLELLRCFGKILAVVGTTSGDISVWEFPGSIALSDGDIGVHNLEGIIPSSPIHLFRAHQTGVNDLSVAIANCDSSTVGFNLIVCSVGDDQTLSTCVLDFVEKSHESNGSHHLKEERVLITKCASASALKAVQLVLDPELYRVYTTGHDEKITMWHLDVNPSHVSIKHVSSSPLGTEGSCIDCVHFEQDGSVYETIAVGGNGIELLSIDLHIFRAAKKLRDANYLLITTGAGFSADSGLMTYECAPVEYRDLCNPSRLLDEPVRFQQFWLRFTQSYANTKPHNGYELLDQWCQGGQLQHLKRLSSKLDGPTQSLSTPWWVYTSNVDGHFRLFKSFDDSLCEIHGSADLFRCACGIGYANGEKRLGKEWDQWNHQWNQHILSMDSCKQTTVQMNQIELRDILNSGGEIFLCSNCRQPMRPNVLMFHDTDENVLKGINTQRERYQTWEGLVEDDVAANSGNLVILEIGCGVNVPAVRQESEEVLSDCAKKIKLQESEGSVCLIRINPTHAEIEMNSEDSFEAIPIASTAASALRKIDCWLKSFDAC